MSDLDKSGAIPTGYDMIKLRHLSKLGLKLKLLPASAVFDLKSHLTEKLTATE